MAIDKSGWTKDSAATVEAKQERFIHGGGLSPQQKGYLATSDKNSALSEKLAKTAPKSHGNTVVRSVVK